MPLQSNSIDPMNQKFVQGQNSTASETWKVNARVKGNRLEGYPIVIFNIFEICRVAVFIAGAGDELPIFWGFMGHVLK